MLSAATTPVNPATRANAPVTLFTGCLGGTRPEGFTTIGAVLDRINGKSDATFRKLSGDLRAAAASAPDQYKALKEKQCPAFLIGKFSARKNDACTDYVPLLGFDIDHSGEDWLSLEVIKLLRRNPFVYAAYLSPSGAGVRFLVWCDASPASHKAYYLAAAEYFARVLNIPTDRELRKTWQGEGMAAEQVATKLKETEHLDTSTNNVARLWFYTAVEDEAFYRNDESQVFKLKPAGDKRKPSKIAKKGGNRTPVGPVSDAEKIDICRAKVRRQNIAPGRNNYVYALACEMARHGTGKEAALSECLQHQESGFSAAEISKTVASAYRAKAPEFTDGQIRKYQTLLSGELPTAPATAPPSTARKEKRPPQQHPQPTTDAGSRDRDENDSNLPVFVRIRSFVKRRYDFRYNEISKEIEVSKKGAGKWEEINEFDHLCELMEAGFKGVEKPFIALIKSSFVPTYDPFQEYFGNLPEWKPEDPDHIEQLANFVTAKDQPWFNLQFKKMLVRSVACALGYIAFNKQCFVLKGAQNDGKSTFLRFLCPPALRDYITEEMDLSNKDSAIALCTNLFINLDELSQFEKKDVTKVKAMLTKDRVKVRLPWAKRATSERRCASFLGSTNDDEFLTDQTGNVRWLIQEITHIKHDGGKANGYSKRVDIDLVYSQAVALLKSGFKFQLTKDELKKSERNNQGFQILTVEQELIQTRFAPAAEGEDGAEFVTATDVLRAIEGETKTTLLLRQVGRALKLLGFRKEKRYFAEHGHQRGGYWVRWIG